MSHTITRSSTGDDMWRQGLTLTERLESAGWRPSGWPKGRRARIHWRRERRGDIARARMLAPAAEPAWWRQFQAIYRGAVPENGLVAPRQGLLTALAPVIAHVGESVRADLSRRSGSLL